MMVYGIGFVVNKLQVKVNMHGIWRIVAIRLR